MKKLFALLLALAMVLACVGCAEKAPAATSEASDLGDPVTFKFALTVAESHPYSVASKNFAKIVEEKSGGNMKVDMYYDGSLGGDAELLDAMQMNSVTFALMGPAGVQALSPMYNFFDLPGLFETTDAAYEFQASDAVKELLAEEQLVASGIRGLGFYENGWYLFSNNDAEITTVADLNNMKMRSMTSDLAIKSWECLNVQPVTMPFGELFVSLQNGTVDGQETTVGSFYSSQFYEVQKYLTQSNRIFHVMTFLMSNTAWEALTEAQQAIIMEAVAESTLGHKENMVTYNQESIDDMVKNHGVVYTESLADGEFEKMKELSAPIYEAVKAIDPDMYEDLIAAADAANAKFPAK